MASGEKERHLFPIALVGLDFGFQSLSFSCSHSDNTSMCRKNSVSDGPPTSVSSINHVIVLKLLRISIFSSA